MFRSITVGLKVLERADDGIRGWKYLKYVNLILLVRLSCTQFCIEHLLNWTEARQVQYVEHENITIYCRNYSEGG